MSDNGAEQVATFALDIETNASDVARTAGALEELRTTIKGDLDALREMNQALRNLKGSGATSADTISKLKDQITATKARVGQNQQAFISLGGSFRRVAKGGAEASGGLKELLTAAKAMPGPVGTMTGRIERLSSLLGGGVIAVGVLAITAALIALGAAAIYAGASLAMYALQQADARRSELLQLEGLSKVRNYWLELAGLQQRAADSSTFLQGAIDQVASSSALGRDRIGEMTSELYRAGLRSGNLQAALQGLAIVESTQGRQQAEIFKARALSAALFGQSIKRLSDDVKARLGGIAKAQLLSLGVQIAKLHESFGRLFGDIKIEKLLTALSSVTELFSQSTASGQALKLLAETVLQPIADWIGAHGILVRRFIQGMILGMLDLAIGVGEVRLWFKRTFGDTDLFKGLDTANFALNIGIGLVFGLAGAFGALGVSLLVVEAPLLIIMGVLGILAYAGYKALEGLNAAYTAISQLDWGPLGTGLIDGIVNGLLGGIPAIIKAVGNVASAAREAWRSMWDMHSPSRIAARESLNIPRGQAEGIDAGRPLVVRAMRRTYDVSLGGITQEPRGAASDTSVAAAPIRVPVEPDARSLDQRSTQRAGNSTAHLEIHEFHVHTQATTAAGQAQDTRTEFEKMLEGIALNLGAKGATA